MYKTMLVVAFVGILMSATPAAAHNEMILLNPADLSNLAVFSIEGNGNRLVIDQTNPGSGTANVVRVSITGNNNGGPEGAAFTGVAGRSGLQPGNIVQNGLGNEVVLTVQGNANLFAAAQSGNNNAVVGRMIGTANQSAITQVGHNNFASFSQSGIGNIINVRQTSW